MQAGLDYFEDLQHRIPRDEIMRFESIFQECAAQTLKLGDWKAANLFAYCTGVLVHSLSIITRAHIHQRNWSCRQPLCLLLHLIVEVSREPHRFGP